MATHPFSQPRPQVQKTTSPAKRPKFFFSIQYYRGFAALMVVFAHSRLPIRDFADPLQGFRYAAIAVDIFFVISGFVMYTSARTETPVEFLRRRIIRIVPFYWLMTAVYLIFTVVLFHTDYTLRRVVLSLLFIPHAAVPGGELAFPVLDAGWTLNAEMFFYAFFLIGLIIKRPVLVPTIAGVGIVIVGQLVQSTNPLLEFYSQTVMLDFVIGLFVGMIVDKAFFARLWPLLPLGLAFVIMMTIIDPALETPPFIHFAIPAILLVVGGLALERRGVMPENQRAKTLGDASYSLYLTHAFLIQIMFHIFSRLPLRGWTQYGSFVVVLYISVITVALVCYRRVELPMTRFLNRRTAGSRARPITPPPEAVSA